MIRNSAGWLKNIKSLYEEAATLMLIPLKVFLPLVFVLVLFSSPGGWAQISQKETEQAAELLATVLNAGRVIVEHHQSLINDPGKGDKGFTPEVFEQLILDEFFQQTHIDLRHSSSAVPSGTRDLLTLLLLTSKKVVAGAQFMINQRGIGYKNFIPATFGSETARKFSNCSHVNLKQTTLNPRNVKNAPNAYEEQVLKQSATQPASATSIMEWIDKGQTLRMLIPIYYLHDCLACHGNPKGILDISGYLREGSRDGDLAGAISVQIPAGRP